MSLMTVGLGATASAATTVYHCTVSGQTVLTDKPCDTPSTAVVSPDGSKSISATPTVVGNWIGQTQYQATENGQLLADAHAVVQFTLSFTPDGKVTGSSPDNGCEMLGLWYSGATPRLFSLDVTLKNCRYSGFNRRYTGRFVATFPTNSGELVLESYTLPVPGQTVTRYDLGATLRR